MALNPLEYMVVGFEENRFKDQILLELCSAWEKGIVHIVHLFLFSKDANGNVVALELSDLSNEKADHLACLTGDLLSLLTPDDILNNRSVAILLFEHPWIIGLKKVIKHAGGTFVAEGLVTPGVLQKLEEALQATQLLTGQQQLAPPPKVLDPAPSSNTEPDVPTQLKQLGALRDSKVITEAEYESAKREILGG